MKPCTVCGVALVPESATEIAYVRLVDAEIVGAQCLPACACCVACRRAFNRGLS